MVHDAKTETRETGNPVTKDIPKEFLSVQPEYAEVESLLNGYPVHHSDQCKHTRLP